MSKDYNISKDGVIYEIREDGSISKIAKISENGLIEQNSTHTSQGTSNSEKGWLWFFLIVFAFATLILGITYSNLNDEYARQCAKTNEYQTKSNKASKRYPIIISSIEIANAYYSGDIETDFGETIHWYNTMYLLPRINYYGLIDGEVTLKTKLYKPDGSLSRGTSSPEGYSQSFSYNVYEGSNKIKLKSWGNENKGHWRRGTYRLEIWFEDVCLGTKRFVIH